MLSTIPTLYTLSHVKLKHGAWNDEENQWAIREVKQWGVRVLKAQGNKCEIVRQIAHIRFPQLKVLSLGSNGLITIEALSRARMLQLETLDLGKNHIRCIRTIRKAHCQKIKRIALNKNSIIDGNSLGECHFPGLLFLDVDIEKPMPSHIVDLRILLRLSAQHFQYLSLEQNRINYNSLISKLKRRWKDTNFI